MNLKGLLPQDIEMLEEFIENVVFSVSIGDDDKDDYFRLLLRCSLGRIAAHRLREEYPKLPGEGWASALPSDTETGHILDWFVSSYVDKAAWLANVDEVGWPKKLMKCRSYDDLMREADKAMDRRNGQQAKALGPDDEAFEAHLGGGYRLVRMLTPEALDLESRRMSHCIGHGSYDKRLTSGWDRYLSVRDHKRRPVATIELRRESNGRWSLRQIAGKHNSKPAREVMDVIRAHAVADDWLDQEFFWPVALAADGTFHDIDRIPAGTTIRGDLEISGGVLESLGLFELPADLTVRGNVTLSARVRIPENLTVCGVLEIDNGGPFVADDDDGDVGVVLPESLHVDREIRIRSRSNLVRPIPTHLYPIIKVYQRKMSGQSLESLRWVETGEGLRDYEDDDTELSLHM